MASEQAVAPFSSESQVFRNISLTIDGKINPACFEPSSADKAALIPSITVWDHAKTSVVESLAFMSETSRGKYTHFSTLSVERIRLIKCEIDNLQSDMIAAAQSATVDVISLPHSNTNLPGHEGHCGVVGLIAPPGMPGPVYKDLRRQMVKEAAKTVEIVPEKK